MNDSSSSDSSDSSVEGQIEPIANGTCGGFLEEPLEAKELGLSGISFHPGEESEIRFRTRGRRQTKDGSQIVTKKIVDTRYILAHPFWLEPSQKLINDALTALPKELTPTKILELERQLNSTQKALEDEVGAKRKREEELESSLEREQKLVEELAQSHTSVKDLQDQLTLLHDLSMLINNFIEEQKKLCQDQIERDTKNLANISKLANNIERESIPLMFCPTASLTPTTPLPSNVLFSENDSCFPWV